MKTTTKAKKAAGHSKKARVALALIGALVATQAAAQERVELMQTGVGWVDKLGAMVQSIINMGSDSVAEYSQPVQANTPTTAQESLTQVLKAMTSFSSKIGPQAPPPKTATTN